MIDAGVKLASMQVQYSLLDPRPETALAGLCARSGLKLLCYGTIAGGFITEQHAHLDADRQVFFRRIRKQAVARHRHQARE